MVKEGISMKPPGPWPVLDIGIGIVLEYDVSIGVNEYTYLLDKQVGRR